MKVDKKLGSFEVTRGYADVIFCLGVVEFGETPVDEAELKKPNVIVPSEPPMCFLLPFGVHGQS